MTDKDKSSFAFRKGGEVVSDRRYVNLMAGHPNGIKAEVDPERMASATAKLRALKEQWAKEDKK